MEVWRFCIVIRLKAEGSSVELESCFTGFHLLNEIVEDVPVDAGAVDVVPEIDTLITENGVIAKHIMGNFFGQNAAVY